jgi:hypothetical protein
LDSQPSAGSHDVERLRAALLANNVAVDYQTLFGELPEDPRAITISIDSNDTTRWPSPSSDRSSFERGKGGGQRCIPQGPKRVGRITGGACTQLPRTMWWRWVRWLAWLGVEGLVFGSASIVGLSRPPHRPRLMLMIATRSHSQVLDY